MILPVSKGSRFSPKQSAQSLFTVFHNILLKCSSTSSSPSCNKWPGLPHYCSLSPAVGGSVQSQMEAKLVSMNLTSPRLKSHMPSFPSARNINTSTMNYQSLVFDSSSSFLSPGSANFVGNPSDPATTLAHAETKAASKAAHRTSAPALASSALELGTWAGVSSLGQVSERDTPPCKISVEPRSSRPDTDFSRAALLSALRASMAVPISTDYPPPWPMAGRPR